jgi:hypothetical protein
MRYIHRTSCFFFLFFSCESCRVLFTTIQQRNETNNTNNTYLAGDNERRVASAGWHGRAIQRRRAILAADSGGRRFKFVFVLFGWIGDRHLFGLLVSELFEFFFFFFSFET